MKKIVGWFFEGLLIITPVLITLYILYLSIMFVSNSLTHLFGYYLTSELPNLNTQWQIVIVSLLLVISIITFIGATAQLWLGRKILNAFDAVIEKTPLVKLLYKSLRDGLKALFVDRNKFKKPVLITMMDVKVPGFITQQDAIAFGVKDHVAVYLPIAFSAAGRVVLVHKDKIQFIEQKASTIMSFLVSGGLTSPTKD